MTSRKSFIDPYLLLQIAMFLTVVLMTIAVVVTTAHAETVVKKTKTTTTTTKTDNDSIEFDDAEDEIMGSGSMFKEPIESEMTANFGSQASTGLSGCKTEDLTKGIVKELKGDCEAWIKDQKSTLKEKFRTSRCEETCSECEMSLKRCKVVGSIRYVK